MEWVIETSAATILDFLKGLRAGLLSPVYHSAQGVRDLKELVRSYEHLVEDSTRVMNRIKALYRSRAISCAGVDVYKVGQREARLQNLPEAAARSRAGRLFSTEESDKSLLQRYPTSDDHRKH